MENKNYNLTEVKSEASEFLETKKNKNETTFLNYRTSFNYFIYYRISFFSFCYWNR